MTVFALMLIAGLIGYRLGLHDGRMERRHATMRRAFNKLGDLSGGSHVE